MMCMFAAYYLCKCCDFNLDSWEISLELTETGSLLSPNAGCCEAVLKDQYGTLCASLECLCCCVWLDLFAAVYFHRNLPFL